MAGQTLEFDVLIKQIGSFLKTADEAAKASGNVRQLSRYLSDIARQRATPVLAVDDKGATAKLDAVRGKLDELGRKVAQARIGVQDKDAQARLAAWAVKLDALGRKTADPRIKVDGVDRAEADILALDAAMDKLGKKAARPKIDTSGLAGPGLGVTAGLLAPAAIPVAAGLAGAAAAIGASLAGTAIPLAAFGLLAKQNFTIASQAAAKVQKAQDNYNIAIAHGTKQSVAYKAEQIAIAKAYAELSPQQIALSKQVGAFSNAWQNVQASTTPLVSGALLPWMSAATKAIQYLKPLITPIAAVFRGWGQDINRYFSSSKGSAEMTRIATSLGKFGAQQMRDIGTFLIDSGHALFNLGRILAGHNVDFGAFGKHLADWGYAFQTWSRSAAARKDVTALLNYFRTNGKTTGDLIKNLGIVLGKLTPGLAGAGQLELKLITDFLGFVARLPQGLAKPLLDTAGALLLLSKTGVLKVGIKIIGPALKWLTGGLVNIGGGATAGAEIRAAMVSGGAAAAAEIRAAMAGGAAAGGAGSIAGGGAAGATAGKAAGGGFIATFRAALSPALAGVVAGALIRAAGDTLSPAGSFAGKLNRNFQADGHLWSSTLLHSFTFGGLEAWLTTKIGLPVGKALNNVGSFIHGSWTKTQHDTASIWGSITGTISGAWRRITGNTQSSATAVHLTAAQQFRLTRDNANTYWSQTGSAVVRGMHTAQNAVGVGSSQIRRDMTGVGVYANTNAGHIAQYTWALTHVPKNVHTNITAHAAGSGTIAASEKIPGFTGTPKAILAFHAAGGRITGGTPGKDSVLGMLMPGEVVVPTRMVQAGAVDHLRGKLPGFATGGLVSDPAGAARFESQQSADFAKNTATSFMEAVARQFRAQASKSAIAASQAAGIGSRVTASGARTGSVAVEQAYAFSLFPAHGWGASQRAPLIALWNQESGWNPYAVNPSSGAYGIPQALGHGHPYNLGDYKAQIQWGENYIATRPGYGSPAAAWAHEVAFNWYGKGGMVPGYAVGGQVGTQGAAWLRAWQDKHGGGFGAAWGPKVVNEQIAEMAAAARRASTLAGAPGLTTGQHRFWAGAAADEKRRLGVLNRELTTERSWRNALGVNELALAREIATAKGIPSLAGPARGWKSQLARDKATVTAISKMLGYSNAYLAAHKPPPKGPPLPAITHTYGGDVANNLGTILASALAPFTGAAKGGLVMDSGGWLKPGFNPVWNKTGRPEHLVPAGGGAGGGVHLHLTVNGPVGSQQQLEDWYVKTANKLAQHGRLTQAVKAASR